MRRRDEVLLMAEAESFASAISIITNKVNQAALEWQNRPLDPLYLIVGMDGILCQLYGKTVQ